MIHSSTARSLSEYLSYRKRFITFADKPVRILFGQRPLLIMQKGNDGHILVLNFGDTDIDFTENFRKKFTEEPYELLFRATNGGTEFSVFDSPEGQTLYFHNQKKRFIIPASSASIIVKQGSPEHTLMSSLLKSQPPILRQEKESASLCSEVFGKGN
jgi:hypothetical protein